MLRGRRPPSLGGAKGMVVGTRSAVGQVKPTVLSKDCVGSCRGLVVVSRAAGPGRRGRLCSTRSCAWCRQKSYPRASVGVCLPCLRETLRSEGTRRFRKNYQTYRTTALSNGIGWKLARSTRHDLLFHPPWRFGRRPRWDSSRPARSWRAVFGRSRGCSFCFRKFSGTYHASISSCPDLVFSGRPGKDVSLGVVPKLAARG